MHVELIGITQPVKSSIPGPSELLAYCARVSSTANQNNHDTGPKLIRSLIKRAEWSPLEMVHMTMEIVTTRDIARQILRHRSFAFQEFSQRYAVAELAYFRDARLQDNKDRQNSIETEDNQLQNWWYEQQHLVSFQAHKAYEKALGLGIAKEVARTLLPEGLTESRLYMAGSLRSWVHYIALRCDRKTQKEHRLIAEKCRDIICEQFPALADVVNEMTKGEA